MVAAPIQSAKDWLQTAEAAMKAKRYAQALYSLEMASEIALKAVLITIHVEVPKVHDIRKTAKTFLTGNTSLPRSFLDGFTEFLATFETLLGLRSMVGYGFETGIGSEELKKLAETLLPKCRKIVAECEKAVKRTEK